MENTNGSKKNILIIGIVVFAVIAGLLIVASGNGDNSTSSNETADTGSEAVTAGSNEVIENTSDMEKLKSSEYTSEGFDSIKIGDSFESVQSSIGTLEKLDIESEYDTYSYKDEKLGSNYVFYFTNNELKEVSVFLA
ncbi:hypothetical protein RZE82_03560 [Mollicutes bacterium LVI A0039]|nr:hypothetical protein RZE82_03560 [Mollicutes bacterium LVI A0039]